MLRYRRPAGTPHRYRISNVATSELVVPRSMFHREPAGVRLRPRSARNCRSAMRCLPFSRRVAGDVAQRLLSEDQKGGIDLPPASA